jgi:hypothetical protein
MEGGGDFNFRQKKKRVYDWERFYNDLPAGSIEKECFTFKDYTSYHGNRKYYKENIYDEIHLPDLESQIREKGLSSLEYFLGPLDREAKAIIQEITAFQDLDTEMNEKLKAFRKGFPWYSQFTKRNNAGQKTIDSKWLTEEIQKEQQKMDKNKYLSKHTNTVFGLSENRLVFDVHGKIVNIWDDEIAIKILKCKVRK